MAHKIVPTEAMPLTLSEVRVLLSWFEGVAFLDAESLTDEDTSLKARLATIEGQMVRRIRAKMRSVEFGTATPTRMRMRQIRRDIKNE
jgi:hypothetical protein